MMEFLEALENMKKGKIVERIRMQRNPEKYVIGFDGLGNLGEANPLRHNGYNVDHTLTREEVEAKDWKLFRGNLFRRKNAKKQ